MQFRNPRWPGCPGNPAHPRPSRGAAPAARAELRVALRQLLRGGPQRAALGVRAGPGPQQRHVPLRAVHGLRQPLAPLLGPQAAPAGPAGPRNKKWWPGSLPMSPPSHLGKSSHLSSWEVCFSQAGKHNGAANLQYGQVDEEGPGGRRLGGGPLFRGWVMQHGRQTAHTPADIAGPR